MKRFVDHSIDKMAVKALVAVFGPREAARQSGIPAGTVMRWAAMHKWKKAARIVPTTGINGNTAIAGKDPAQALQDAIQAHGDTSSLHLAHYAANAAKKASSHKDPLSIARQVRDVAQVHRIVHPPEEGGELIEGAILVGGMKVTDNPQEMLARCEVVDDADPKDAN